jgi:membrane fusion protein, multidrug efflux system
MKTRIISLVVLTTLMACGGSKQEQLEALKKQHDKIALQIEQLEKEIALSADSSSLKEGKFVAIEEIEPKSFSHYIEVQGKLDGDENIAIYPEAMGVLVHVYARAGDHVSAGQVLAQVNDAAFQEQLKTLQTTYAFAQETFQKQENLWKQQIGSEIQYLQAKTNKESLETQIAAVKKQIDMTRIKSPISGTIEESLVKVGQAVSTAMPSFRVVNFSNLKVTADLAEAYTSKVNTGDEVIAYLPDIKKEIAARVTFCSKYINPTNRTFSVEAQLKTNADHLKANMVTILKIEDYNAPKAFVLPLNVIQTDNKGKYVLIAKQDSNRFVAVKQPVETGQLYNGLAEVTSGLTQGTRVITSGYLDLNEGQTIRF